MDALSDVLRAVRLTGAFFCLCSVGQVMLLNISVKFYKGHTMRSFVVGVNKIGVPRGSFWHLLARERRITIAMAGWQ